MHQFDISKQLFRLASILDSKAETALAKAKEHAKAQRLDDWRKETNNAENAVYFADVCRQGADRLKPHGKKSPDFVAPTWEEVCDYAKEKHPTWPMDDLRSWFDHFVSVDWKVGDKPMKNWNAAANNGFKRWRAKGQPAQSGQRSLFQTSQVAPPPAGDPQGWKEFCEGMQRKPMEYRYAPEWMKREFRARK